jgi:hypothetical protein
MEKASAHHTSLTGAGASVVRFDFEGIKRILEFLGAPHSIDVEPEGQRLVKDTSPRGKLPLTS